MGRDESPPESPERGWIPVAEVALRGDASWTRADSLLTAVFVASPFVLGPTAQLAHNGWALVPDMTPGAPVTDAVLAYVVTTLSYCVPFLALLLWNGWKLRQDKKRGRGQIAQLSTMGVEFSTDWFEQRIPWASIVATGTHRHQLQLYGPGGTLYGTLPMDLLTEWGRTFVLDQLGHAKSGRWGVESSHLRYVDGWSFAIVAATVGVWLRGIPGV